MEIFLFSENVNKKPTKNMRNIFVLLTLLEESALLVKYVSEKFQQTLTIFKKFDGNLARIFEHLLNTYQLILISIQMPWEIYTKEQSS